MVFVKYCDHQRVTHDIPLMEGLEVDYRVKLRIVLQFKVSATQYCTMMFAFFTFAFLA